MHRLVMSNRGETVVPFLAGIVVLIGAVAAGTVIGLKPEWAPALLAIPLALVAAWAALRAPGVTFAAYLAIPFYKAATDPYLPIDLTVILAVVNFMQAVLFFLPAVIAPGSRPVDPARRGALLVWFSLTVLIVLGVLYAPSTEFAINRAGTWVLLAALPLLAAFRVASDPRFIRQLLWTLFAIGAAVTLVGLWLLPTIGAWPNDRLVVFGAHTIRVGQAALLVPLIGFAYILPTSRALVRLACLALMVPALLVSVSSGSRGPLVTAAITLAIFALRGVAVRLFASHRPLTIAPVRLAAVGVAALLVLILVPPSTILRAVPDTAAERVSSVTDIATGILAQDLNQTAPDTSTSYRLLVFDDAMTMFNRNPIIGGGTASFADFTVGSSELSDWTVDVAYPHNLLLQFAAEYGLVGLLVLAVVLAVAFRGLIGRVQDPAWLTVLMLLVFFLLGAMVSSGIVDNRTLWGFVALGLAANAISDVGRHPAGIPAIARRGRRSRAFEPTS